MEGLLLSFVKTDNLGHIKNQAWRRGKQPSHNYTYFIFKLFIMADNINTSFYMNNRLPWTWYCEVNEQTMKNSTLSQPWTDETGNVWRYKFCTSFLD